MHFRPVPESDQEQFRSMLSYAFAPDQSPEIESSPFPSKPEADPWGLYDNGELVSACHLHEEEILIRDEWRPIGGISDIVTRPIYRRQGYFHHLLKGVFRNLHDRGVPMTALWPSAYPPYAAVGFTYLSQFATVTLSPEVLTFTNQYASGEFKQLQSESGSISRVDTLYEQYGTRWDLALRRSTQRWQTRVLRRDGKKAYIILWTNDTGEDAAYLLYTISNSTLRVRDFAYRDQEAYLNLLRFLHFHQAQVNSIQLYVPSVEPLLQLIPRPNKLDASVYPGPMGRLVHVEKALDGQPATEDLTDPLVIDVHDQQLPANDGCYTLIVDNGRVSCAPASNNSPDIACDISSLTKLFVGVLDFEVALAKDELELLSDRSDALRAIFPTRDCWLREYF